MKFFHEQYKKQIKQLADQMRNEKMPPLTEGLFVLFETTGNRLKYEEVYFARRKFLAVFGIAAYVFRRREDVVKLEEVLLEICQEECWALPAHVNRRENPDWRTTVDLFASETAQALAEIVTLVNDETQEEAIEQHGTRLSGELCEMVRSEIERRVFVPFEIKSQGWECSDHNWNAVCSGGIGSAAMYLLAEKEKERLELLLQRICHSLTYYLDGFRADGTCMEGIGYFTYGMTYFTGFAEQLLRYSDGTINLFANEKVRKIAEFQQKMYFGCGQTVSFSDGDNQAKFRMGLTNFLAVQYDTVRIPMHRFAADFETDPCYRFMGLVRDVLWTRETGKSVAVFETARHDILPYAQWSICESKTKVGFAMKGGDNGEPHNHNDVGSFIYLADGEQLICDLGAGEYTAEYFGAGRYDILCNSSEGHNVPVVAGGFQQTGKQYRAASFSADGQGTTVIEFAGAYAKEGIDKLMRTAEFSMENGELKITDFMNLLQEPEQKIVRYFTETLVTRGMVELREHQVIIQGSKTSCLVLLEGEYQNLRCTEKVHSNHEGKQEIIRLLHWDVVPEKKGTQCYGISKYTIRQI